MTLKGNTVMTTDFQTLKNQVEKAANKAAIIQLVRQHLGDGYVSKNMRKKSLEALRKQVVTWCEHGHREATETPEVQRLRDEVDRLRQRYQSLSYATTGPGATQKIINKADQAARDLHQAEAEIDAALAA